MWRRDFKFMAPVAVGVVVIGVASLPARASDEKALSSEAKEARERLVEKIDHPWPASVPDNDPQMRADFMLLAKADPGAALDLLKTHQPQFLIRTEGIMRWSEKFYAPGLNEIGESAPDLLVDWLLKLDDDSFGGWLIFDGAESLAGQPDRLASLLDPEKRKIKSVGDLPKRFTAGSLGWLGLTPLELEDRVMRSENLSTFYRDKILLDIVNLKGPGMPVPTAKKLLTDTYGTDTRKQMMVSLLSMSSEGEGEVAALLDLVPPDLGLSVIRSNRGHGDGKEFYDLYPRQVIDILAKATPTREHERAGNFLLDGIKAHQPDLVKSFLAGLPKSEWKRALAEGKETTRPGNSPFQPVAPTLSPSAAPNPLFIERMARVAQQGLTAAELEGMQTLERSLLFAEAIGCQRGSPANWEWTIATYLKDAPLVTLEERLPALSYRAWWIAQDAPEAAAKWFEKLTTSEERVTAVKGIISGWGPLDIQAASSWLESVQDPKAKKAGAQELMLQLTSDETPLREEWEPVAERQ